MVKCADFGVTLGRSRAQRIIVACQPCMTCDITPRGVMSPPTAAVGMRSTPGIHPATGPASRLRPSP